MVHIKYKLKKLLFLFGGLITVFIVLVVLGLNETKKDSLYYRNVGLELVGIVQEVKPLKYGHNYGVISISINQSNIKEYDKRGELDRFLGVIKDGKADLVFNLISSVTTGDSIIVCGKKFKLFRNGKLIMENYIGMPPKSFFATPFKEVNRKIKL